MAVTAAAVLAARAAVMERIVVLLERTKHGALSRATKAQAEHLATVAEGMEGKVRYDAVLSRAALQLSVSRRLQCRAPSRQFLTCNIMQSNEA
jgi:hypothetical protein